MSYHTFWVTTQDGLIYFQCFRAGHRADSSATYLLQSVACFEVAIALRARPNCSYNNFSFFVCLRSI
jgi:hypothetical protein